MTKKTDILTRAAIAAAACVALTGCVRDDIPDCPPLSVMIGIEDKNYSNIDDVEEATGLDHRVDEGKPFRAYIQKLYYSLTDTGTGEVVFTQHLHDVSGDAPLATARLPKDLPFGTYALTVWGNIDNEEPVRDNGRYYTMHTDEVEGYDVYMTNDTLVYDYTHADYTVSLKRVKGKLIVQGVNLPEDLSLSEKQITNLSLYAGRHGLYVGSGAVTDSTALSGHPEVITNTVLAPTAADAESDVQFRLFADDGDEPRYSTDRVGLTFERNTIEVIRLVYNEEQDKIIVYILVDGAWKQVHNLGLE